ncbi:peptidase MA family metallohydrolase [Thermoflavimicrobium dichotomicum]|uniref:Peptidase MA superfamily protein n=1 Tax=Thermoflavimicrobium dichotomicum TaxID=46223 RepID=A0A1I3TN66_9BACL|nr:peptidase MA family metallohydrolase [Thermoflavimicrobium dichotomicum]SFJ72668.1 Peptidase MA superfamily protein [Thermoflavimicrobium dichotomicum]
MIGLCQYLLIFLLIWSGFWPYSLEDKTDSLILKIVAQKEQAVNKKDWGVYQSVLDAEKPFYKQEQKRWFEDAIKYIDPGSFRLKVLSLSRKTPHEYQAWIDQSYRKNGKKYAIQYPLRFRYTPMGWKDADLIFHQVKNDFISAYFTDLSLKEEGVLALNVLKKAARILKEKYRWEPKQVEVKLYHQPELFRQSIKLSLPQWAVGWHEANQAIKFIGGVISKEEMASGMVHELIHQMISELTNDNAAYWLQEGAATYYERHLLGTSDNIQIPSIVYSLPELEKIHLESLPSDQAYLYYQSCYRIFDFLIQQYGEKKVKELFSQLAKKAYLDQESDQKQERTVRRTKEAIKEVLGISSEQLEKKWRSSLKKDIDFPKVI